MKQIEELKLSDMVKKIEDIRLSNVVKEIEEKNIVEAIKNLPNFLLNNIQDNVSDVKDIKNITINNKTDSIPDQIKKLHELKDLGIISNEEFQNKKKKLLDRIWNESKKNRPYSNSCKKSWGITKILQRFFIKVGDTHIELLEPTSNDSTVSKFLEKRGEGLHHIAIKVDNINEYLSKLDENNVVLIDKEPKLGAKNKKIAFVHPKSTSGVLLELCEEVDNSVYPIL